MRRLSAVFAAIVLALGLGIAAATPATAVDLSDTGQAAVGDLRTCLASHDVLNAYYIIDNSQSLRVEDDGSTPGSDPEKMRAEILANSLAQLGRLGEGKTVNWAAGFFSTDFDPSIGWTPWSEDSGDRLEAAVRAKIPAGFTNWLAAMEGVQGELASQPDRGSACQLVVWFTDGAIDLAEGARATSNALNDLCGQRIDPDGHRPDGYGILNSFRQSGVVVIGTLLAQGSTRDAAEVMWPLVESSGTVGGQEASCGQPDPPENAVRGAVVDASDPDALALVFLELASQIGGGYPRPLDDEGRFWIDPGVSRFQIALGSDDWRLIPPAGSGLADITADTLGVATAEDTGGATRLEVVVDDGMHGRWQLDATDVRDVFLFSDLSIEFDEQNEVEVSDDGQIRATLNAQLVRNGTPASLEDFASREVAAWIKSADGLEPIAGAVVDPGTGEIAIPLPSDVSTAQITVKASIDPLTTAEHGLSLAPVFSNEVTVATVLPANFPTITDLPVTLSDLEGADGEAHGVMTVDGPATGGDGSICLPEDPDVKSDSADRRDSWQWHVTDDLDANRCVVVEEGVRGQQIGIRVSNEVAADSEVLATLGVTFTSSSGGAVDRDVEIAFRSTHPVDAVAVGLLTLGLLLLGILLPLLALWLLNWRTTRLDIDSGIQRASFAVRIGPGGVAFVDAPASDAALGERFHYRPPQRNVRAVDDADLGRLAAHVPWFPLAEPTYRISPRAGTTIVGARTSARAASAGVRRDDGSMEFRQLPLDAFWAVTVSHAELARTARGDDVNGAAVLYHRMDPAQQDQYRARLNDIGLEGSLGEAVDRARAALTQAAATKKGASAPAAASAPGDTTPTPHRDGAPPPRGGSAPPPRDGSPPPRDGSPPPRGGTAPPPRPGSPGSPPPRPGSPPPPRGR